MNKNRFAHLRTISESPAHATSVQLINDSQLSRILINACHPFGHAAMACMECEVWGDSQDVVYK